MKKITFHNFSKQKLLNWHSFPDATLASIVLAVIGMMIIPLPTLILDFLIASNVSFSILVLLIALYLKKPLSFSSFPTLLLVTTLFRLGLNVSSTRLILIQADAGEVIQSFGEFVVKGNYVVGGVVFLLITIVQFMVIAKGSERVAEVGARFTLDALPGKQMGIDADLRSGNITQAQAMELRDALGQESQFYGAMDGAMKFVKGDAIAALVISGINIIGGLVVGTLFFNLSISESVKTFSLLTIGDGLVSQIPSLLISTSAGLVITRVSSERINQSLGQEIVAQLASNPTPIKIVSVFILALGLFPGLPWVPFVLLSILTFSLALFLEKKPNALLSLSEQEKAQKTKASSPLQVEIHLQKEESLHNQSKAQIKKQIPAFIQHIETKYGVPLTNIEANFSWTNSNSFYSLLLHNNTIGEGKLQNNKNLALAAPNELAQKGIRGQLGADPLNGSPATWIDSSQLHILQGDQIQFLNHTEIIFRHLEKAIKPHLHSLIGIQETKYLLRNLESHKPDLTHEVIPSLITVAQLTHVLRRLLMENVSIHSLEEILNTIALHQTPEAPKPSIIKLTDIVRLGIQSALIKGLHRKQTIQVFHVDPEIESIVQDYLHTISDSQKYLIPLDIKKEIQQAFLKTLKKQSTNHLHTPLILLCKAEVRRCLWEVLSETSTSHVVLSYPEIPSTISVQSLGTFSVGNQTP